MIKIDVDGYETEVVKDARKTSPMVSRVAVAPDTSTRDVMSAFCEAEPERLCDDPACRGFSRGSQDIRVSNPRDLSDGAPVMGLMADAHLRERVGKAV